MPLKIETIHDLEQSLYTSLSALQYTRKAMAEPEIADSNTVYVIIESVIFSPYSMLLFPSSGVSCLSYLLQLRQNRIQPTNRQE